MSAVPVEKKAWNILDLITWGSAYLTEKGISDARLNIELLLAYVLRLPRIQLYTNFDKPLSAEELARCKELLKRRLAHEPLQYILGETEFMGLKFSVDKRVLIPRPDTEVLVEFAVNKLKQTFNSSSEIQVLEIGTGSGCIAVSVAKSMQNAVVTAIDVAPDALEAAKANAERNGVQERITFLQKDFFKNDTFEKKFHCVVSNPPYVSHYEFQLLPKEVKEFEPKNALTDGSDGLTFYKAIAQDGKSLLHDNGFVAVEHAYNQSEEVQKIFRHSGWKSILSLKDYGGNFRVVIAEP